jgi:hypothetical protein
MKTPKIDNVSAGYVFAYDAKTGDVLWTHEKIVEVNRGREERPTRLTAAECEQVRAEAAQVFRGREVEALIAPEGFAPGENVRVSVEPSKKALRVIPDEPRSLADRFADHSQDVSRDTP